MLAVDPLTDRRYIVRYIITFNALKVNQILYIFKYITRLFFTDIYNMHKLAKQFLYANPFFYIYCKLSILFAVKKQ